MTKSPVQLRFPRTAPAALVLWFMASVLVHAASLPAARPETVGLSSERLERLSRRSESKSVPKRANVRRYHWADAAAMPDADPLTIMKCWSSA